MSTDNDDVRSAARQIAPGLVRDRMEWAADEIERLRAAKDTEVSEAYEIIVANGAEIERLRAMVIKADAHMAYLAGWKEQAEKGLARIMAADSL